MAPCFTGRQLKLAHTTVWMQQQDNINIYTSFYIYKSMTQRKYYRETFKLGKENAWCTHIYTVYLQTCTHACMHARTHTHTHTHACMYVYIFLVTQFFMQWTHFCKWKLNGRTIIVHSQFPTVRIHPWSQYPSLPPISQWHRGSGDITRHLGQRVWNTSWRLPKPPV